MLNLQHCHYRKSLFSFALIPLVITSGGIGSENLVTSQHSSKSGQAIAQNTFTGWVASFWQRRPRRRLAARSTSGICALSPGLVETYIVWHDRPLFLWQSPGNNEDVQLIVREYDSQTVVWKQRVNTADQKVLYGGQAPLEAGKLYQWQLLDDSATSNWTTFQVMLAGNRGKIQADLQTLEQKLRSTRASEEEIALRKADYFLNYQLKHKTEESIVHPWSDALQALYEVEQPSASFVKEREAYVANLCTSEFSTNRVK